MQKTNLKTYRLDCVPPPNSRIWVPTPALQNVTLLKMRPSCLHAQSFQLYRTLWDPTDCSPSGFSVHRTLQARIPEGVAIPSSRGSFQSRDRTCISCITGRFFTAEPPGRPKAFREASKLKSSGWALVMIGVLIKREIWTQKRQCEETRDKIAINKRRRKA